MIKMAGNEGSPIDMIRALLVVVTTGVSFGVIMAVACGAFVQGVAYATTLRERVGFLEVGVAGFQLNMAVVVGLLLAAILVLAVRRWFAITRWHGPADSIHAAHRTDNELDIKSGFGSTLAAFISASGGASVGQYGPLVHFGATMGSFVRRRMGGVLSTDIFIGCGVAGAISAGFDTPIAGVIFAHEAILRHFSLRAIAPIAIASITAAWVRDRIFEGASFFQIESVASDIGALLPAALIAGPFFGLLAVLFMLAVRQSARLAKASKWSEPTLVLTAVGAMCVITMIVPETLGLGTTVMQQMLLGEYVGTHLLIILIAKILATAVCIGFGFAGGMFFPALFVGLAAGGLCARLFAWLGFAMASPGLAICGMAAVASAVIGAPITGVLLVLEMTLSYEFAMAAMLAIVVSNLTSHLIFGHSFFDRQLQDRGIDVSQGRGHLEMMEMSVSTVVSDNYVTVLPTATVREAMMMMTSASNNGTRSHGFSEAYIVDMGGRYSGKVSLHSLMNKMGEDSVMSYVDGDCVSIKHDASVQQATEIASGFVGESIPVVSRNQERLIGVVREGDLLQLYLGLHNRIRDLERA